MVTGLCAESMRPMVEVALVWVKLQVSEGGGS